MRRQYSEKIFKHYPSCRRFMGEKILELAAGAFAATTAPNDVPQILLSLAEELHLPPFLPDLARLELLIYQIESCSAVLPNDISGHQINPTLQTIELSWRHLLSLTKKGDEDSGVVDPESGREVVLMWRQSSSGALSAKVADDEDLLVLKVILEGLLPEDVASAGNIPIGAVDRALDRAAAKGLILTPGSLLRRDQVVFPDNCVVDRARFFTADAFTLQWHLTQACDLHCRHCYDRSSRSSLGLDQALAVLDDLRSFCRSRHARGNVSFSGGNPLLYPHFFELYQGAKDRGFNLAILGNPASREIIEKLIAIHKPALYQVSLEGLPEHNDYIRGEGHFERVMTFLDLLKDLGIYSMVMLTLTRDNLDQVIPLAEKLRGKVDSFTFNRLAMVGEGASLQSVAPADFREFLPAFMVAAKDDPSIRLKDNLFNIIRQQEGRELFRGCAGYGCGAAFNFLTLLPDGEVHACRKFPSPVGNILEQDFVEIYESQAAQHYRHGSDSCRGCAIRSACGGCQAVVHGMGLDPATDRDPYCFIDS
ncbi:MAG: thio(seleno)oxazole modification radical SAM maturase SbtM [Thermodesulfobacteriota bacterium]